MEKKKGGIKTSMLLFSLLLILSFLLFFYAFSILSDNRVEIAKKLTNVNECTNVKYDLFNPVFQGNNITLTIKNDINSIRIVKISAITDTNLYKQDISVNPGEIKRITIAGIPPKDQVNIYVNDCDEYKKLVSANV